MKNLIFLTVPGLRRQDVQRMPNLSSLFESPMVELSHSFPAVTWPAQATMLTGEKANQHGVVANGFYWRDQQKVEMWTAWNEVIQRPQLWDQLKTIGISTAAWFPMLSKGCNADVVCMPAPIHQPDGSEDLWCYTKPQEFYGQLLEELDHFPLKHFWGPLANIESTRWIARSAAIAAQKFKPQFFYIYLPHLDYAAQKFGPDSDQANQAVEALDQVIGAMIESMQKIYDDVDWVVASEYVITAVDHVCYPNRELREAGLLAIKEEMGREHLDLSASQCWAMVDHQFSHIFVRDRDRDVIQRIVRRFSQTEGIQCVLTGAQRGPLDHPRSGDVILTSTANSWQSYYWWNDDAKAPQFATTVDIHKKPGYDPVELFFNFEKMEVPLDANLIKGSHGYDWGGDLTGNPPGDGDSPQAVLMTTLPIKATKIADTEVFDIVMNYFQRPLP
jgi:predicted AlkP superfamily pyrophosphatase or phosphodiesterase